VFFLAQGQLRLQPLGDVQGGAQVAKEVACGRAELSQGKQDPQRRSILAHVGPLPLLHLVRLQAHAEDVEAGHGSAPFGLEGAGVGLEFPGIMEGHQVPEADDFGGGIAQHAFGPAAESGDEPFSIRGDDGDAQG